MGLAVGILCQALVLALVSRSALVNATRTWDMYSRAGVNPRNESDDSSRQMQSLVTIEGKSYFVADVRKNWRDAMMYCAANGLELATIESRKQWECLEDALRNKQEWWIFWTAGRDSRELPMFLWAASGPQVNAAVVQYYNNKFLDGEEHHYCLSLYNIPPGSSTTRYGVYSILCSQLHNVMCQGRAVKG